MESDLSTVAKLMWRDGFPFFSIATMQPSINVQIMKLWTRRQTRTVLPSLLTFRPNRATIVPDVSGSEGRRNIDTIRRKDVNRTAMSWD